MNPTNDYGITDLDSTKIKISIKCINLALLNNNEIAPIKSNSPVHELGWWITILTAQPLYLYYFGPFTFRQEAESIKDRFIEDLRQENALILCTHIRFLQPSQVTVTGTDLLMHIISFQKIPKARIASRQLA